MRSPWKKRTELRNAPPKPYMWRVWMDNWGVVFSWEEQEDSSISFSRWYRRRSGWCGWNPDRNRWVCESQSNMTCNGESSKRIPGTWRYAEYGRSDRTPRKLRAFLMSQKMEHLPTAD